MATKAEIILSAVDRTKAAFSSVGNSLDTLQTRVSGFVGKATAIAGVGLAITGAFAALQNIQALKILDQFDDMAEKTGITVEALSELRFAGEAVGTPLEALSTGISKLGKNMAEAAGGNKEAIATFKALKVEVTNSDGTLRSSEAVLRDLAERFAGYEDGAAKAALAQRVFGKTGEAMIPLLNLGADGILRLRREAEQLGAIYDTKVAKAAADFNDNLAKIKLSSEAAAVSIAGPFIQSLADLSKEFLEAKKNGGLFAAGWASYTAGVKSFWNGNMFGTSDSAKSRAEALDNIKPEDSMDAVFRRFQRPRTQTPAPVIEDPGAKGPKAPVDDPTKKLLENELKNLERSVTQERELMASRNEFLNLYNEQGLISFGDYFDQRQAILDESTEKQVKAYDAQLKALQDYLAKTPKATDRAETEGKINELLDKRSKVEREAGTQAIKFGFERQKAAKDYKDELDEVNAKLLEMEGKLGAAAAIRFDKQFDGVLKLFNANNNAQAVAMVRNLKEIQVAQAELSKVQQSFSLVQGDLQIAEDRITLARERGTIGEIEGLRASGEARQRAVEKLREQLALFEKIDAAARTPEQQQSVDRLRLQVEQLGATLDPLADRFNTMISGAAGDALTSIFDKTATPKEAAKRFFSSVFSDISGMLIKDFAKTAFGGGESGGIGGILSRALGGGKSGGGLLGGLFGGKAGTTLGATPANALFVRLADPTSLLGAQSSGSGGAADSSLLGSLGSLFGGSGGGYSAADQAGLDTLIAGLASFDVGTDYVPEDMIAKIHKGERIVPAAQNKPGYGGGVSVAIYQSFAANTNRRTTDQAAQDAASAINRAQRNR